MTEFAGSAFDLLEAEHRLVNAVYKGPTKVPGRFGFRGELALRFKDKTADEARPPELVSAQVLTVAQQGDQSLPFFAGYLASFEDLKSLAEVLSRGLNGGGKYFVFCGNIDLSTRYQVPYRGALWYVLPLDEATVYNEMLELLDIEKNDLKKLDTAGKIDAIANAATGYDVTFDMMTYAEGLGRMGPVKDPGENRPV